LMRPNVSGRIAKVSISGGRRVVYGSVARRKDCGGRLVTFHGVMAHTAYSELPTSP
jgi:hypothetical protein